MPLDMRPHHAAPAAIHYTRGGRFRRAGMLSIRAGGYAWCNGKPRRGTDVLADVTCKSCKRIAETSTEER